jgi:RNA polymerase sigma factor (sigma-70 family)
MKMDKGSPTTETQASFHRLLEEYGRFLRSVIVRTCPRHLGIEIDDIEQDARIRMWRALQDERNLTNAASYIYRIAVSATIDAVRRVMARHEEQAESDTDIESDMSVPAVDPRQSPERVAERSQLMQKVEAALAALSENRQTAVKLYLQGMTSQEIGDLCAWSEPKARNLIYRGLNELRNQLRDKGIDMTDI